jgi:hypothetical protein
MAARNAAEDLHALKGSLVAACQGRDLSDAAIAALERLLKHGTDDEIEEVLAHLRYLPPVRRVDVCPDTTKRFVKLWAARCDRVDAQKKRLRAAAFRLAQQVAAYQLTASDAQVRVERLIAAPDPDSQVPVPLLAAREANEIATEAFRQGFTSMRKEP